MAKSTSSAADCDTDPSAITAERARELIRATVTPIAQAERVAVRAGLGRVLAADVHSQVCVPNHTNSAMDGYAVRDEDLPASGAAKLRVVGTAMAGAPFAAKVARGECVRIMTGAVLPDGADRVVIQERVTRDADVAVMSADARRGGANVRRAGEDLAVGDVALQSGCRLRPSHLGLAASLGIAELSVLRRARVAFFSNGDELRGVGETLALGDVFDSNRYTLFGMLSELGVEMVDLGVVPDDAAAVARVAGEAAACADMVIASAGASAGEADYMRDTLAARGEVVFHKVAVKPGRPLLFGKLNDALFFGLPGNPVSVMVTFAVFVMPALRQLAGEVDAAPLTLPAKTETPLRKRAGRAEYQRGVLSAAADGALTVCSTGEQGSGILKSMGEANCFIVLPTDVGDVAAGDTVQVQPFAQFI